MNFPALFSPLQIGPYRLDHRVVMAPLTRMRAERSSFAPRELNAEYYKQRATPGGLIIAEASPVMAAGGGEPPPPRIYSGQKSARGGGARDSRHARHLFGTTDRRLARRRRCGSRQWRIDLSPTLACRTCLAFLV